MTIALVGNGHGHGHGNGNGNGNGRRAMVILPKRKEDIPENVRNDLKLHMVSSIEEVLELALTPGEAFAVPAGQRWQLQLN